jgi:very-short-patch-repair endonuclease
VAAFLGVQQPKFASPREAAAVEHVDVKIAALVAAQHGVVSRRQLSAAGVSPEAIKHRIAVHRLRRVHRGVYAIGHRLSVEGHFIAAVLACGDGAGVSHRAAAALYDLMPAAAGRVDVTVPRGGGSRRAGITIHHTRSLPAAELATRNRVPCTSWARTVVDLAGVLTKGRLERLLERSETLRLFDLRALNATLAGAGGRRGIAAFRYLLGEMDDEPPPTRTELERLFLDAVKQAGLPRPVVNAVVAGYEVDFHWPRERLIAETDGRATHDTAFAFERDRRRDLDLELAGWHVVRISHRQLRHESGRVVGALRKRLRAA